MTGDLTGIHYSHAWRAHQKMCEVTERFLWERRVHEVKPAISNDLQQAAAENADKISFEIIPCSSFQLQKFDQFKGRVKGSENWLLLDL